MAHKGTRRNRRKAQRPTVRLRGAHGNQSVGDAHHQADLTTDSEERPEVLYRQWSESRSGARAGRGFHFQNSVGALLAARLISGTFGADVLVPEGFDDMTLEGTNALHVQIKSRAERVGQFPTSDACRHILNAWVNHRKRNTDCGKLAVVFERGVQGTDTLRELNQPLSESLPSGCTLRSKLIDTAKKRGMNPAQISEFLSSTSVVGIAWEQITAETCAEIAGLFSIPPASQSLVAKYLRTIVAEASDINADPDIGNRKKLSRTDLMAAIESIVEQIDVDALERAVIDGICKPLTFDNQNADERHFYEGTATQPFHVAAGLVVPRPDLMDRILFGLDEKSATVITGPSGIGKSAMLWSIALARPRVLWYRVLRLSPGDVPVLIRLARANLATLESPVGFLIDAAGANGVDGWVRLRNEVESTQGILLAATARTEDMIILGDLSGCTTVAVQLDESAAKGIFDGLVRRGATSEAHWAESFESSHGLTLEFTHFLTKGRRLGDVIKEQVRRRVVENRHLELEILKLVSVADRWSASVSLAQIASTGNWREWDVRASIERLADEHLVVERDGMVSGLHRLRSVAICDAIHNRPPPELTTTAKTVISLLPDRQIHMFVANLLRDLPLAQLPMVETAIDESSTPARLAGFLHAFRLYDFYNLAAIWNEVADHLEVPQASRPLLFAFTAVGIPFSDSLPAELRAAQVELRSVTTESLRNQLISRLGEEELALQLAMEGDISNAIQSLAVLEGASLKLFEALRQAIATDCPVVRAMKDASIGLLAEFLATARDCHLSVAEALIEQLGGHDQILARLQANDPWITEIEVKDANEGFVAFARTLHISDALQGDPEKRVIELGRLLLRCLPAIESVDVQALTPGGYEIRINDYVHGISRLQRRYDRSTLGVAWNQARIRTTLTLIGETDANRLAKSLPLFDQAADLTLEVATQWLTGKHIQHPIEELAIRVSGLHKSAVELKPPLGASELGNAAIDDISSGIEADRLSALLFDLTGNVFRRLAEPNQHGPLAAYISSTILEKHLKSVVNEPWATLGFETFPESLGRLRQHLHDLHAVVYEFATNKAAIRKIHRAARSGIPTFALRRAAETSRRIASSRTKARCGAIQEICNSTGISTNVWVCQTPQATLLEFAVTVKLDSLIDWPEALSKLGPALQFEKPVNETYTIVPLRAGRTVPALAMKLIREITTATEMGAWTSVLPKAAPTRLFDAFDNAQLALQALSGIGFLPKDQRQHCSVEAITEAARSKLEHSYQALRALGTNPVCDELAALVEELAIQVRAEINGEHAGPKFSEEIIAGALEIKQSDELNAILSARLIALEWDIQPKHAVELVTNFPN